MRMIRYMTLWSAVAVGLGALGACADIVGIRERYVAEAEGAAGAGGAATDPRWSCLDVEPPSSSPKPIDVAISIFDAFGSSNPARLEGPPVKGAEVRGCSRLDSGCATVATNVVTTGDDGTAVVRVPGNFLGYLEIRHPDFLPTIYYHYRLSRGGAPLRAGLLRESLLVVTTSAMGAPYDRSRGFVIKTIFDCQEQTTSGATFSLSGGDASTVGWFLSGGFPTMRAQSTDESGIGGFVNTPLGSVNTETMVHGSVVNAQTALVRAGWITNMNEGPG